MLLSDAIRLFVSDESMSLAINGGRIYILGEGETIPVDERKEDYRMMGKLKTKMDSFFDGLDSDYILSAKRYVIPVDKANVVASGILSEQEAADAVDEVMAEYRELRLISECHCKARRYPAIKSWFLKKYPEIEEFGQEKNSDDAATDTDSEYAVVMEPLEKAG